MLARTKNGFAPKICARCGLVYEWRKKWERLFFLISSARHFATALEKESFTVEYIKALTAIAGLTAIAKKHKKLPISCAEPSSFTQYQQLRDHGVTFIENDFFLTPRSLFSQWAVEQKTYLMESFYRKQRTRLEILMQGKDPIGGAWNFDKANRLHPAEIIHAAVKAFNKARSRLNLPKDLSDKSLAGANM